MTAHTSPRRRFFAGALLGAASLGLGCADRDEDEAPIAPNEDLMSEHGVLMRAIALWQHVDAQLRTGQLASAEALGRSVAVVRELIQEHHERTEEEHVFPILERAGREVPLVRTLREQHQLGRAATHEVATLLEGPLDEAAHVRVADRLGAFGRMMTAHLSREDTVVFPTFRTLLGDRYPTYGEVMEPGEDEEAEDEIGEAARSLAQSEEALGVGDLGSWSIDRA